MIFLLLVVQGLMFILTGGERVSEGKICSKKILERSKLKADDLLMVVRCGTDEVVAQFNCINWNCRDHPDTEGRFNRTGDLVLILPNCSSLDRFDVFLNLNLILQNFTLEEVLLCSATPAPTDEALNQNINRTAGGHNNTILHWAFIWPAAVLITTVTIIAIISIIIIIIFWKCCKPVQPQQPGNDLEMSQ